MLRLLYSHEKWTDKIVCWPGGKARLAEGGVDELLLGLVVITDPLHEKAWPLRKKTSTLHKCTCLDSYTNIILDYAEVSLNPDANMLQPL